jgi:hypothetical protein
MNIGITVAHIPKNKNKSKHTAVENYEKFGNKYWDDGKGNNSKVGYYFVYYFQKKMVYVHKIIKEINEPDNKPPLMKDWDTKNKILCLGPLLKEFTWEEWKSNIGYGAPYTLDKTGNIRKGKTERGQANTCGWSLEQLRQYNKFNFDKFKNTIENDNVSVLSELPIEIPSVQEETIVDETEEQELERRINEIRKQKRTKELKQNIVAIRENERARIETRIESFRRQRDELISRLERLDKQIEEKEQERDDIMNGKYDNILIDNELQKQPTTTKQIINKPIRIGGPHANGLNKHRDKISR